MMRFAFALAVTMALAMSNSLGAAVASPELSEGAEEQPSWVLRDHFTDEVLAQGHGDFTVEGVQVRPRTAREGEVFFNVYHSLTDDIVAGASVYPLAGPDSRRGFGLWLKSETIPSFSWDWFSVVGSGIARKIQGGGGVSFEIGEVDGRFQMTSIRVEDDIVLRGTDTENDAANVVPDGVPYRWSCTIRAGTEIPLAR